MNTFVLLSLCRMLLQFSCISCELKVITRPLYLSENLYFELLEPEEISYTFKVRPAKDFGAVLNVTLVNIDLWPVEPAHGCSELTNADDVMGTVALIERGQCSFLSKIIQAEHAGALAAIVMDNDETNDQFMIDMVQDETDRSTAIPAFFMLGRDGDMIKKTLSALNVPSALINIPINVTGIPTDQPPWTLL